MNERKRNDFSDFFVVLKIIMLKEVKRGLSCIQREVNQKKIQQKRLGH
jgi:hypothetical protein